jgi:very-short-patch-repair endonuclease
MTGFRGHRRLNNLKDWMPAFAREVTRLHRDGSIVDAEEAERAGHVWPIKPAQSLGEVLAKSLKLNFEMEAVTDSPIEAALASAMVRLSRSHPFKGMVHFVSKGGLLSTEAMRDAFANDAARGSERVFVYPQVKIGQYRVDFLVVQLASAGEARCFIVACDGRDYHTKEDQIARDKARDRALQALALKVFRFTATEIWDDPELLARFILNQACKPFLSKRWQP